MFGADFGFYLSGFLCTFELSRLYNYYNVCNCEISGSSQFASKIKVLTEMLNWSQCHRAIISSWLDHSLW